MLCSTKGGRRTVPYLVAPFLAKAGTKVGFGDKEGTLT